MSPKVLRVVVVLGARACLTRSMPRATTLLPFCVAAERRLGIARAGSMRKRKL